LTFESINEVCIKWRKDIDNAILGEIKQKAIENGIKTEYVLNEKAIISALEKQIPKKPTPQIVKGGKRLIGNGWWCEGTTVYKCPNCNEFISRTYDYCYKCGQALDWGDTNDT
jgi:hypothetical protein